MLSTKNWEYSELYTVIVDVSEEFIFSWINCNLFVAATWIVEPGRTAAISKRIYTVSLLPLSSSWWRIPQKDLIFEGILSFAFIQYRCNHQHLWYVCLLPSDRFTVRQHLGPFGKFKVNLDSSNIFWKVQSNQLQCLYFSSWLFQ